MQIHFIKQFPWGEPSHFVEKIWAGFSLNDFLWDNRDGCWSTETFKEKWPYGDAEELEGWWSAYMKAKPKIHTIRDDEKDRWKAETMIHFVQWIGKAYHSKIYHFAPIIPCMNVQKIQINYWDKTNPNVVIDGRILTDESEYIKLAQNDGFDTVDDFFKWFNKDYEGKIIHWTDLKY